MPVLTILPEGQRLPVRAGETIEAALVRAGYQRGRKGCRRGGCGMCVLQLVKGTTVDERPIATTVLTPAARAAGRILVCRAVPVSDVTIEPEPGQLRCVSPVQRMLAERELAASTTSPSTTSASTNSTANQKGS